MGNCFRNWNEEELYSDQLVSTDEEIESKFKFGNVIGTGRFSEVRKATDSTGKSFAVKCIRLSDVRHELHLLKREVSILKKVSHPNILRLHEVYQDAEYLYLVMDLYPNGNLADLVNKLGPLPVDKAKVVARFLLSALSHLHSMNICHRDIKPENILFSETGKPVLADFGFARYITSVNGLSTLGTPLFLAPEINDGTYDSKCDVWSLGISLYYALTGLLPFKGEFIDELMRNIKLAPIAWDKLGDEESSFLKGMLERNYKHRASADELLSHEWLTGHKNTVEI